MLSDGYYPVSVACAMLGLVILVVIIRPLVKKLEAMSDAVWRLPNTDGAESRGYSKVKDVEDSGMGDLKQH